MVKVKVPQSERKDLKKLLKKYYAGNYTKPIISKAAEKGVTLSESDVYSFFNQGIHVHASIISDVVFVLVQDAKAKEAERKERLQTLNNPPKSASL